MKVKCNYKECKDPNCPHRVEHEETDRCFPVYCQFSVPYKKVGCVKIEEIKEVVDVE